MPHSKKPKDIFAGIKRAPVDRRPPKREIRVKEPQGPIVAENDKVVTVALTMPRDLFELYNDPKSRGKFRDAMVRQLARKFE